MKLKFGNKPGSIGLVDFANDYHLTLRLESALHCFYFEVDSGYDLMETIIAIDTVANVSFLAPNVEVEQHSAGPDTYYKSKNSWLL